jgi:hypothetical protein
MDHQSGNLDRQLAEISHRAFSHKSITTSVIFLGHVVSFAVSLIANQISNYINSQVE